MKWKEVSFSTWPRKWPALSEKAETQTIWSHSLPMRHIVVLVLGHKPSGQKPPGQKPLGKIPLGKIPLDKKPLGKNPLNKNLCAKTSRTTPPPKMCMDKIYLWEKRIRIFTYTVENQLEIEFLYGKDKKFWHQLANRSFSFHIFFTHKNKKISCLQMKKYNKVHKEINYNDTNTFSKNIIC